MIRRVRRPAYADATTKDLARSGVLKVDVRGHAPRRERVRVPYSFGTAVKYITLLSLLLWWMPTFGQMIAGYVGGRRAGSPWKAALAACVPVLALYGVLYARQSGYFTVEIAFLVALPAMAAQSVSSNIPVLAPYVAFVSAYLTTFVAFLKSTIAVGLSGYLVTIIFAYVGGVVAQQKLREIRYTGFGMSTRTVVTAPMERRIVTPAASTWASAQDAHLANLRKIPVVTKGKPATGRRVRKVAAARKETAKAAEEPPPAVPRERPSKYNKDAVNRRLVERALSHYRQDSR
jgi:hypothetical protein